LRREVWHFLKELLAVAVFWRRQVPLAGPGELGGNLVLDTLFREDFGMDPDAHDFQPFTDIRRRLPLLQANRYPAVILLAR
jgi:hypothetical protein